MWWYQVSYVYATVFTRPCAIHTFQAKWRPLALPSVALHFCHAEPYRILNVCALWRYSKENG
jgi:hypothetical protein